MPNKLKYQSSFLIRAEIKQGFFKKTFKTCIEHGTPDFLSAGNRISSNIYHPLLALFWKEVSEPQYDYLEMCKQLR